ncbi:HDOD domain-containing protein [Simiduia aestuariiviva]|uniref:HD-like signal output (HDOD) protein n=1 Tax=Simiduia aestuariiviva TaxID=1510459 RepID=A0A839UPA5_9GAMM|nr:HDOD domain-containing protein [Simiduia aestuariiviva]MBB3168551.1 HD-like signal output (HDOD) protein [Simiduia aestuariiviva]
MQFAEQALVARELVPGLDQPASVSPWVDAEVLAAQLKKSGWFSYFQQLQAAQLGVAGYWWLANPNLQQALSAQGGVLTSWLPGLSIDLAEIGRGRLVLQHRLPWLTVFSGALVWHLVRQALGEGAKLAGFAVPNIGQAAEGLLGTYSEEVALVESGAPAKLRFDPELLQRPFVTQNAKLLPLFANTLSFLRPGGESGLASQIYALLEAIENLEHANQSWVAAELAMSERTLTRQLSDQGLSFRELLTAFRNSQAVTRLCEGESIDRLAAYLGFSERAAFERAFKSWQGVTPAKFQAQYRRLSKDIDVEMLIAPERLPILPAIATQLLAMVQSDEASLEKMAELVEQDPVLTAKLISIASSAYYGMKKNASIKAVVVRVFGVDKLRYLALAILAAGSFKLQPCPAFSFERFWLLSLGVAQLATGIYRKLGKSAEDQADIYLAGLLHNIGRLVLVQCFPDKMQNLLAPLAISVPPQELLAMEKLKLGVDACEAGAVLLAKWQLPRSVSVVMRQLAVDKVAMMPEAQLLLLSEEFILALLASGGDEASSSQEDLATAQASDHQASTPELVAEFSGVLAAALDTPASVIEPLLVDFAHRLPELKLTARVIQSAS